MSLTYNGITIDQVMTERLELVPEKDPSGVDQLYTRFTLRIRTILYPGVNPSNPGEDPADAMKRIRHMLLTPRAPLSYSVNGKVVVETKGRDDENGPETTCEYDELRPGAFLMAFTVTVRLTDCENAASKDYLSLKWTDSIVDNAQMISTRRRTGTLVISPNRTPDANSMRPLVTPDVPSGFRREHSEYTLSEDGRIIRFTFVDKAMMQSPPDIAVRMRGVQVESATPPGSVRMGMIRLRLDGTLGTSKKDLLAAAVYAAMSRVYASGPLQSSTGRILMGWSVSEGLGDDECWVELSVNWRIKPDKSRSNTSGVTKKTTPGLLTWLISPPLAAGITIRSAITNGAGPKPNAAGKDTAAISGAPAWVGAALPNATPGRIVAPPANGLANAVKLVAAILNDPCGQTSELVAGGGFDAELRTGGPGFGGLNGDAAATAVNSGTGTLTAQVVPAESIPPDDQQGLYDDGKPGVYDEYTIVSRYRYNSGKVVLASTKVGEPAREVQLHNPTLKLTVEWTAVKVGGPLVIPKPANSPDGLAIWKDGTITTNETEIAADGVSERHEASGIYEYEYTRPELASIAAPLVPFLSCDLADSSNRVLAFTSDCIVFPGSASSATNPFTGQGVTEVKCCGTAELRSTGEVGFNPSLGAGVNP